MATTSYQVTGLTHKITATATSSQIEITPTEAGTNFAGQRGPFYLKITNGSSSDNIYFATGPTSQTAVIPTGDGASAGSCVIPAYAEVIVAVANPNNTPVPIYVAAIAANSSPVYVTPVSIVG